MRKLLRLSLCVPIAFALAWGLFKGLEHVGVVGAQASPVQAGDISDARSDRPGVRVLFVGNSLTFFNEMPALLTHLVESDPANRPIFAVRFSPGGYTLAEAADNHRLSGLLDAAKWDYVVLQEQSGRVEFEGPDRDVYMLPPARVLAGRIRSLGGRPILFETWGDRNGGGFPGDSYAAMQDRIDETYREVAGEIAAPLAPVGMAWAEALRRRPTIDLWLADDHHPSLLGSYLAACVFYALLYHRDPSSSYTAGLSPSDAVFLQQVARSVTSPSPS